MPGQPENVSDGHGSPHRLRRSRSARPTVAAATGAPSRWMALSSARTPAASTQRVRSSTTGSTGARARRPRHPGYRLMFARCTERDQPIPDAAAREHVAARRAVQQRPDVRGIEHRGDLERQQLGAVGAAGEARQLRLADRASEEHEPLLVDRSRAARGRRRPWPRHRPRRRGRSTRRRTPGSRSSPATARRSRRDGRRHAARSSAGRDDRVDEDLARGLDGGELQVELGAEERRDVALAHAGVGRERADREAVETTERRLVDR